MTPKTTDMEPAVVLHSTITCPFCGRASLETMPVDACLWYFHCPGCGTLLTPIEGDCCVFCSYGSVPCPPVQQSRKGATGQDPT